MKLEHLKNTFKIAALAVWCCLTESGLGQPSYQVPVGARPRSMGEAFVAVADDGNAIRWNPAGLGRMELIQANFAYANLFGLGIHHYYASFLSRVYFIPPLTDYLTFGADWSGIHTRDEEAGNEVLRFTQDQFNLALALRPPRHWAWLEHLNLGLNGKYMNQTGSLDGNPEGDAHGWGWDVGLLYDLGALRHVPPGIHFGLMFNDVNGTLVKHETGTKEEVLPQSLRWGLSYRPFEIWPGGNIPLSDPVLALDVDDRVHVGLEFWLARTVAFRAGWQKDRHTEEGATLSFGIGIRANPKDWPEAKIDYALTDAPGLPNTDAQFGGMLVFKNNPRLLRIEEAHINDVYASLYRHYGLPGASAGYVKIKNVSARDTLKAWVDFLASAYMKPQRPDTLLITPGRTIDLPLRAVFEPDILNAQPRRLTGNVNVSYEYQRAEHTSHAAVDFALQGRNRLIWDDACRAAAFVTVDDKLVGQFVNSVRAVKTDSTKAPWFTRYARGEAMKLYHALQALNLAYRPDPVTPFPALADTLRGAHYRLDQIAYPAAFLSREKRHGDCDDLSVLYASLLQHAGFATALVSVPGHVFMMFDTELDTAQRRALPLPPELFVPYHGTLWIPVETTMLPDSNFTGAWKTAAGRFDKNEPLEIFEVAACQSKYPPAENLEFFQRALPALPDFGYRWEKNLLALERMKQEYFQSFESALSPSRALAAEDLETLKLRNRYGALLAENGEFEAAARQFETIRQADPSFAPAWNNRGNVEFMLGHFKRAETCYDSTLWHNPFSRGTYLNLAILYQMMKDGASADSAEYYQRKSDAALLKAAQYLEADAQAAYELLGVPTQHANGTVAGPIDWVMERVRKVRKLVDTAFRMYVQKKEIRGVVLDRHGPKGSNEVDGDRGVALYWSY